MRVGVADQEKDLENNQARRPNARRAAEPGKQGLSEERLHLKEEKRAQKDRGTVTKTQSPRGDMSLFCHD